jgi:hypothetical protein
MKIILLICLFILTFASSAMAQQPENKPTPAPAAPVAPEANPADVASIDAIVKAVYEVISGEAGEQRDWNRFRSLFHSQARMIPTGKNPQNGMVGARPLTPEEYVQRSEPFMMKEGFFEKEIARRTEVYGNIAHVFSTYESFHKKGDAKPFMRGINSIQLLNNGKRWLVMSIYWQQETPENPLPEKYLKSDQ